MLDKKTRKEKFKQTRIELGEQIKKLRLEHNMTLSEFSQASKINLRKLEWFENGQRFPDWGSLLALTSYFDKSFKITIVD